MKKTEITVTHYEHNGEHFYAIPDCGLFMHDKYGMYYVAADSQRAGYEIYSNEDYIKEDPHGSIAYRRSQAQKEDIKSKLFDKLFDVVPDTIREYDDIVEGLEDKYGAEFIALMYEHLDDLCENIKSFVAAGFDRPEEAIRRYAPYFADDRATFSAILGAMKAELGSRLVARVNSDIRILESFFGS